MNLYTSINENSSSSLVINFPHSGLFIPSWIKNQFKKIPPPILTNSDWFVDRLFTPLFSINVTALKANYSRYVVDLNRSPMFPFVGHWKEFPVYKNTTWDRPLYDKDPTPEQGFIRLDLYFHPYHQKLEKLIQKKLQSFPKVILLDIHSFGGNSVNEDICLGNRDHTTSSEAVLGTLTHCLKNQDLSVAQNDTYKGRYIIEEYGSSKGPVEAIQIEINYKAYLTRKIEEDEVSPEDTLNPPFRETRKKLKSAFQNFLAYIK